MTKGICCPCCCIQRRVNCCRSSLLSIRRCEEKTLLRNWSASLGLTLVLQITRADGAVEGPDVLGQREVVAEKRNVVLLRRLDLDGVGAGAQGTAEILEDDDGYIGVLGRAQDRGVFEVVVYALADELGVSREGRESGQDNSGGDQRRSAHSR